jgi:rod shape-determining protein MreC
MRRLTRRQRVAVVVLAATALCFITLDIGGGALNSAHTGARGALGALYRGTDTVLGPARRYLQGVPSAGTNQARVQRLEHDNAVLRGQLDADAADRSTSARLATLQLAADHGGYRILPARVIALGPGQGFDWTVTIDAGTRAGIRAEQTVTDGDGLVGRVLEADANTSVVLLAADPGSGVGARDLTSGEVGVLTGHGADGFTFVPLNPAAVLHVGDRLATGPTGATSFVSNLSIGTVTAVRSGADGTEHAEVRPTSSPTALDLVGVILVGGGGSGGGAPANTDRPALSPSIQAQGPGGQR